MAEEILQESKNEITDIPTRQNPFCVISKNTFGEYSVRDIQSNSAWGSNPYGEDYAVVPDDMVQAILETRGFCDIVLNDAGTEIAGFTPLEIPEIPEPEPEVSIETRMEQLESNQIATEQTITDMDLSDIETQQTLTDMDLRIMELEMGGTE